MQKTIIKNRARLNELESEKQSLEQVLERTSNLYAQTIRERHEMTKTWSNAVQTLNERHKAIHETMEVRKYIHLQFGIGLNFQFSSFTNRKSSKREY